MSGKSFYYEGKRFKNGRISIRFSPEEREALQKLSSAEERTASGIVLASCKLDAFDCELISEAPECFGNSSWFLQLYCNNNAKTYHFCEGHLNDLMEGRTAVLYPVN